jgi:basic membrane lipoprotein Med (substrate-binding protein (PBP1-ABC) superfamily)
MVDMATRNQKKAAAEAITPWWRRRSTWWISGVGVVAAATVVTALVLSSGPAGRTLPPPRARIYTDAQACLLTGAQGIADPQAAPVWAGMEDASAKTRAKVSYLQVTGPATAANALPFANSLVQGRCDVVLGVGAAQTTALAQDAAAYPKVRFVLVGGSGDGANVSVVPATDPAGVRAAVSDAVAKATAS